MNDIHSTDLDSSELPSVNPLADDEFLELMQIFEEQEEFERFLQNNLDESSAGDKRSGKPSFNFFHTICFIITSINMMISNFFSNLR